VNMGFQNDVNVGQSAHLFMVVDSRLVIVDWDGPGASHDVPERVERWDANARYHTVVCTCGKRRIFGGLWDLRAMGVG